MSANSRHARSGPAKARRFPSKHALRVGGAGIGALAMVGAIIGSGSAGAQVSSYSPLTPAEAQGPERPVEGADAWADMKAAAELAERRAAEAEAARKAAAAAAAKAAAEKKAAEAAAARKAAAERAARAAARAAWVSPISNYRLSAGFGAGGSLWSSGRHTGQDFSAPRGTTVRAVAAGKVISAGSAGAYGKQIAIRHSDGTVTTYSHLSSISVGSGTVTAGQKIGTVGTTGNTTGPHLHFEVLKGGSQVNPLKYLRAKGARV